MSSKYRKGGRPPLPDKEKRSRQINISLTEKEYLRVEKLAQRSGKKVSHLFRDMAFKSRVTFLPEVNKATVAELGKIGGLIKVIVIQAREGERSLSGAQIDWLNNVVRLIKDIRSQVTQ